MNSFRDLQLFLRLGRSPLLEHFDIFWAENTFKCLNSVNQLLAKTLFHRLRTSVKEKEAQLKVNGQVFPVTPKPLKKKFCDFWSGF